MLNFPSFFNAQVGGYEIEQSLRFNKADTPYLNKVFTTVGDEQKFTISFWFKTTNVGNSTASNLVGAGYDGNNYFNIDIKNASVGEFLHIFNYTPSTGYEFQLKTTRLLRDSSAWMHLVLAVDTTQATASNRVKIWLNGVQETSFATESYPAQNRSNLWWGGNTSNGIGLASQETAIGRRPPGGPEYANAYIAEFNSIDGQYLTHEDFGEFDDNGVWRPIKYTGTYTDNSFYLKFDAADVDGDSSGLGNDFTAYNFTTSGTGTDVMSDTPTTNWCTLNPLQQSNDTTLSDGNLRFAGSVSKGMICGTQGATSGKYYWEFIVDNSGQDMSAGITNLDETVLNLGSGGSIPGRNTWSWGLYMYPLNTYIKKVHNTVYTDTSATKVSNGDVIGIAYDAGAGKMWASKNNTWMDSGDPAAGTNALFTNLSGTLAPAVQPPGGGVSTTNTANFGQRAFAYTPPTGFKALNTSNLSAPTVKDGSQYFDTKLYTGSGGSQSLTGLGFQPELVWIKARSTASSHGLYDAVRGVGKVLLSNSTSAEQNYGSYGVTSFDAAGFSVNDLPGYGVNQSGITYAAWCWDAGGTGSSNTDGTITSTVSANPSAGFSIVSYTGNGVNGATVGHGLAISPDFTIVKSRTDSSRPWPVESSAFTGRMLLNTTNAVTQFSHLKPYTDTVLTLEGGTTSNASGGNYIAYCWTEIEGYSKFGSYTGNGSANGPFVFCNFRPRWVMVKASSSDPSGGGWWNIFDATRNTYNVATSRLGANSSSAESNLYQWMDLLSNGFKLRQLLDGSNVSGVTYIYAAFAEHPFGGSGVSPATAR